MYLCPKAICTGFAQALMERTLLSMVATKAFECDVGARRDGCDEELHLPHSHGKGQENEIK